MQEASGNCATDLPPTPPPKPPRVPPPPPAAPKPVLRRALSETLRSRQTRSNSLPAQLSARASAPCAPEGSALLPGAPPRAFAWKSGTRALFELRDIADTTARLKAAELLRAHQEETARAEREREFEPGDASPRSPRPAACSAWRGGTAALKEQRAAAAAAATAEEDARQREAEAQERRLAEQRRREEEQRRQREAEEAGEAWEGSHEARKSRGPPRVPSAPSLRCRVRGASASSAAAVKLAGPPQPAPAAVVVRATGVRVSVGVDDAKREPKLPRPLPPTLA
eukprot:m51a1_g6418 hypothetical protein (283) ;mRNA; f:299632-300480